MKNVAGFDLPKLMVGSLGTLGMIATATFRLHPLPESTETLLLAKRSAKAVRSMVADLREAQLEPVAVVAIWEGSGFDVAVRFEGFRAGVVAQRDGLFQRHRTSGGCDVLDPDAAKHLWMRHDDIRTAGSLKLKIAALPSAIEMVSNSVAAPFLGAMSGGGFIWYPLTGLGFITGTPSDEPGTAVAIERARQELVMARGSLTILAAPATIRGLAVWGDPGPALSLMQSTKQRFDPAGRFAPGRFVGGI